MCRRVRLTERLALARWEERILAPMSQANKAAAVIFDELAERIEAEATIKRERILGGVYLYHAEIGSGFSEVLKHMLHQLRTNSAALKRRIDNEKIQESRFLREDEADDRVSVDENLSECRFPDMLTERVRGGLSQ